ncbi:hypothetical protein ES705_28365 [subsurface metagenome]
MKETLLILQNNQLISLFEDWGLNHNLIMAILLLLIIILVILLVKIFKSLITFFINSKTGNDLKPFFTYLNVKEARKYFIQTQYQNAAPTREEEPDFSHKYISRNLLMPFFLNIAFNEKKESEKFYLILADSGMGKSTFMINLFVRYNSFLNLKKKHQIKLFPLGDIRVLDRIRQIKPEEAKNTILLLDALDEDPYGIPQKEDTTLTEAQAFRKRLDEIMEVVQNFREVVITSRTQFLPGEEEKPYELKIPRYDGEGYHELCKLYISPFNPNEIKKYLKKKYGYLKFRNIYRKRHAKRIVENSPKLMVRPMLLSYINDLAKNEQNFKYTYQIYGALIDKWIERETKKYQVMEKKDAYKKNLYCYSHQTALEIYNNRKQNKSLHLLKEEAIKISRKYDINLKDYEITGQSLLTRDAEYNWKFAHKSILAYFLAKEAFDNPKFEKQLNFAEIDMTELFHNEMILDKITIPLLTSNNISGQYGTDNNRKLRDLKELKKREIPDINYLKLFDSKYEDAKALKPLRKLKVFIDPRDGQKYHTIKIGDQVWMAENFAYIPNDFPLKKYGIWVYGYEGNDMKEVKATENFKTYGCLYDWETANNKGICPPGWHLPSKEEFELLQKTVGGTGKHTHNNLIIGGTSGFNARFGGWRFSNGTFNGKAVGVSFWSSTKGNVSGAWSYYLSKDAGIDGFQYKGLGFAVRCLKD